MDMYIGYLFSTFLLQTINERSENTKKNYVYFRIRRKFFFQRRIRVQFLVGKQRSRPDRNFEVTPWAVMLEMLPWHRTAILITVEKRRRFVYRSTIGTHRRLYLLIWSRERKRTDG